MEENGVHRKSFVRRIITVQLIVDVTLWLTVALPVLYLFLYGRPRVQGFFCDDLSLSYPYKPDTISTPVLVVYGFAISVAVIVSVEILNSLDIRCRSTCRHTGDVMYCIKAYCLFLIGFVVEEMFVDVVKNKMGVLRPNFFDVCKPEFNRTLCPGYITIYTCAGRDVNEILRSRQSFPSGHSAFSSYIAIFFSIYIQKTMKIRLSHVLKVFLQSGLVFLAVLCGLERITDNKHHSADVIGGFFVGSCVAVFVWLVLGNKIFVHRLSKEKNQPEKDVENVEETQNICCNCRQANDSEPQTPEPLLACNKLFFHAIDNEHTSDMNNPKNVTNAK